MLTSLLPCQQVLQKDATRHLPRFAFHAKTAQQYLASRQWMVGLALDVAGALLMILAFAMAPVRVSRTHRSMLLALSPLNSHYAFLLVAQVSIVQPVSGLGLGTVAVFSHFYLKVHSLASLLRNNEKQLLTEPCSCIANSAVSSTGEG